MTSPARRIVRDPDTGEPIAVSCAACREVLPLADFHRQDNKRAVVPVSSYCRDCSAMLHRERDAAKRAEKIAARACHTPPLRGKPEEKGHYARTRRGY